MLPFLWPSLTQLHERVPVHRRWLKTHDGCIKNGNYKIFAGLVTIVEENDKKKKSRKILRSGVTTVLLHFRHISGSDLTTNTAGVSQDSKMLPTSTRELKVRSEVPDSHDIFSLDSWAVKRVCRWKLLTDFIHSASFTHRHHLNITTQAAATFLNHFIRELRANGPRPVVEPSCNRSSDRQQRGCCHHSVKCSFSPSVILNRWSEDTHCFQTSAFQKINEEIRIKGCKT